jgi:hypothetical protein
MVRKDAVFALGANGLAEVWAGRGQQQIPPPHHRCKRAWEGARPPDCHPAFLYSSLLSCLGSHLGWLAWAWSFLLGFSCRRVRVVLGPHAEAQFGSPDCCGWAHSCFVDPPRPRRIRPPPLRSLLVLVVTPPPRSSSVLPALILEVL